MDTPNSLNETQEISNTQNPQGSADPRGASEGADFQSTAPSEALNRQAEDLSVESTGQPADTSTQANIDNSTMWLTGIGVLLLAAVVIIVSYKIIREDTVDNYVSAPAKPNPKAKTSKSSSVKKKPAKKKSTRKKTTKRR